MARFARGHLGIVGHYRQAHVEAGPFAALGEARAAWIRIRAELERFRAARVASRRDGTAWPPPGAGGAGWVAQAGYTARCRGCASRADRRAARAGSWGDGAAETAEDDEPGRPAGGALVRRRTVAARPGAG